MTRVQTLEEARCETCGGEFKWHLLATLGSPMRCAGVCRGCGAIARAREGYEDEGGGWMWRSVYTPPEAIGGRPA